MVVGATIVSLGTTAPEAAVSVLAAVQGAPGLALGNAVGSVITDTGMILGLACLIAPLRLDPKIVNRQGWIQLGAGVLLVLLSVPWTRPEQTFGEGGRLSQQSGFLLLVLLATYLYVSVRWAGQHRAATEGGEDLGRGPAWLTLIKLVVALAVVVISAHVVIPGVTEAAMRISVPESVIAATLVAFGTSLPELVTAVTAARRGQGELAVGNVIGADILNVLFVAGAAAAVTPVGLHAGGNFFSVLFPAMLFILVIFRIGIFVSQDALRRGFGYVLLAAYCIYIVAGYHLLPKGLPGA
jgi:cation:H+ antiporter